MTKVYTRIKFKKLAEMCTITKTKCSPGVQKVTIEGITSKGAEVDNHIVFTKGEHAGYKATKDVLTESQLLVTANGGRASII